MMGGLLAAVLTLATLTLVILPWWAGRPVSPNDVLEQQDWGELEASVGRLIETWYCSFAAASWNGWIRRCVAIAVARCGREWGDDATDGTLGAFVGCPGVGPSGKGGLVTDRR